MIVGSGAGGLGAAGYLAKNGWDVLVLEQGAQLGGYLGGFEREGFHFTPGVHYVGEAHPGGLLHDALAQLGVDAERAFAELDPDAFHVYRFPGTDVRVCRGVERYRDRLAALFPRERDGLARFFGTVRALSEATFAMAPSHETSWRTRMARLSQLPVLLRWQGRTFAELLAASIRDPHLRTILAGTSGSYGLPPSRASALMGTGVLANYANGAFFPRGGSAALRDRIVEQAERHGARFRTRAPVKSILVRDGKAVGVVLEHGERIEADVVISDADPVVTFGQLLDPAVLPERLLRKVRNTEHTMSTFAVYLGMRRDLRRHGLGPFDTWSFPDWDLESMYARAGDAPLRHEPMFLMSPNSLKDDTGAMAREGSSTLEIITFAPYRHFERFRDRPLGSRGPEYEAEKQRMTDWLLESVERRQPGVIGDVVVTEASTPLTNEWYVRAVNGAAFGPARTPRQSGMRSFRTTTPIPNLFLAGAGVFGDGVWPCLQSGLGAARAALRHEAARERRPGPAPRPAARPSEARA